MRTKLSVLLAGVALVGLTMPVVAHHAVGAEYDEAKVVKLTGVVSKVEWTNPHARIYIDVEADGKVVNWDFELGPPNGLMRQGWNRNSLQQGHVVKISGFLSKDQPNVANARSVFLPDGRQVFAGSSFDVDAAATPPAQ